ncbi:MAG TPA: DUF4388 domain-containing protein [Anaerolineae bacterium]|nr:DUF4388 domain-containing protein [Anaerolineae bacterium]
MALKGNLRDFSTTQLLNLINLARKTGLLVVESKNGAAQVFFREGKLVYAAYGGQDGRLTSMLVRSGKLTPAQANKINEQPEARNNRELGALLIQSGHLTQSDIVASVKAHVLDVVYRLFSWTEGTFRFEPSQLPPEDRTIQVRVDLENVIMEGSRRIKEIERLREELPNLDVALRFTDRPDARLRNINLSVDEWRVVSFINPKNSIRQIAQASNMSEFQIRKIVYGMLQAGLVEVMTPLGRAPREAAPAAQAGAPPAQVTMTVKRPVIERLIRFFERK